MTVNLILTPLITETTIFLTKSNWYTFRVDKSFTKNQIKKTVESLFKVTVLAIKTSTVKEGNKRSLRTRKTSLGSIWKKVIVHIKPDQKIPIFDISTN